MIEEKNCKNKVSFGVFLTSVLTFFLLGVFLAEQIGNLYVKNIKKSDINTLVSQEEDLDLKKFWGVYELLKDRYYSLEGIEKGDLVDGAIAGMVEAIGDKHTEFMNSSDTKSFNDVLNGDFEGIGAVVEKNPLGVKIDRILKGSPAKKYGLLKDDIITSANDNELMDLSIMQSVEKIKGPAGTKVLLKVLRSGEKELLEIEVIRAKIKIPTIEEKDFDDIGYISINMYGEKTASDFKKALNNFKEKDGIIIDLRENGGGYLQSAVEILSNFVESGKELVLVKGKTMFQSTSYKSKNNGVNYNGKIVVLINGSSASASEITAGALKDYNKAILVGTKSYGKGSVQEPFLFPDGSQLKFTIAKWFTPEGINIDEQGINPDISVEFEKQDYNYNYCIEEGYCDKNLKKDDFETYDRQLEVAKEVLKKFIDSDVINIAISNYLEDNPEYKKDETKSGSTNE